MRKVSIAFMLALVTIGAGTGASANDRTLCFTIGPGNWEERVDESLAACTRFIAKAKGKRRGEGYASRGHKLTKKKQYAEALKDFEQALKLDPKNVEIYDYRADVYLAMGDLDTAIANYDQSIRIDPTYAAAHYSRGVAYERKGDIERAKENYRAALVPLRERKLKLQERIQEWAQDAARKRLKDLDEAAKSGRPK